MRSSPLVRQVLLLLALAAVAALAPTPAMAQHAQTRQGFFFSGGLGYGSMGLGCDGCDGLDREGGVNGYLTIGGTLSPNILLGAETNGWVKSSNGTTQSLSNLMVTGYFYPMAAQGLFLKAGLGGSSLIGDFNTLDDDLVSKFGLGLMVGAGYDIHIGANTSLTPYATYLRGNFDGASADVVQAGVGITLH
jgi:hypothetical protein